MHNRTACPTCGRLAAIVDWSGNAECGNCGAEFNERDQRERIAAARREEFFRRTGKRPAVEKKRRYAV